MHTVFWALRSFVFVLWMAVTVVPWGLAVLIASIFVRGEPLYALCVGWLRWAMGGCRVICGVHSRVRGLSNLPEGRVVLLPKHQSTWETFAFPTLMPRPLCYVFKRELLYIPFFGWAMSRINMIHIDRSRRTEAWARVAEQGRRFMAQDHWVIMFPEGTRTPRGGQGQYKFGGVRLALSTGAKVVPIAVSSARCWPRKSFLVRPGVIDVSIGPAIDPAGRGADDVTREVEAWIEAEMRRIDPEAYAPRPAPAPRSAATPTPTPTAIAAAGPAPAPSPAA